MQDVVFEEPYEFVPPIRHSRWVTACTYILRRHLKRTYGITDWTVKHIDRLQASLKAGDSVLLCPNHCRPSDPLAMGIISYEIKQPLYSMASWHVFKQSKVQSFMTRRLGGFSIYREGMDRTALNYGIDILTTADRPLIIFPEGVISRTNDKLAELMDGTAFVARAAAKKRAAMEPAKKVVVHPVGLRYTFEGDVDKAIAPILTDIEKRLSLNSGSQLPSLQRVCRVANTLVTIKELDYIGSVQSGSIHDRVDSLIDHMLHPIEQEWCKGPRDGSCVVRVKNIRTAIVPTLVAGDITDAERKRRWKQLADAYLAQQLWFYPRDYLTEDSRPERLLETVERIEEDLTDSARVHQGWHLTMEFGEAIEVAPKRVRGEAGDPLMRKIDHSLREMLGDPAAAGSAAALNGPAKQSA